MLNDIICISSKLTSADVCLLSASALSSSSSSFIRSFHFCNCFNQRRPAKFVLFTFGHKNNIKKCKKISQNLATSAQRISIPSKTIFIPPLLFLMMLINWPIANANGKYPPFLLPHLIYSAFLLLSSFISFSIVIVSLFLINSGAFAFSLSCIDKSPGLGIPSDCPNRLELCQHPLYKELMADQCQLSCGLCGTSLRGNLARTSRVRGALSSCADGIGPNGLSDCPKFPERCTDPLWMGVMRQECPLTCGQCPPPPPPPFQPQIPQVVFYDYPQLANSISPTLRPCDDFYEYVCEGYKREHQKEHKKGGHQQISHISAAADNTNAAIIDILTDPVFRQRFRPNPLFTPAYTFFDACIDLDNRLKDKRILMPRIFDEIRSRAPQMNTEWLKGVYPISPLETKIVKYGPHHPLVFPFLIFLEIPLSTTKVGQFARNPNAMLYQLTILEPQIQEGSNQRDLEGIMELVFRDDLELNRATGPVMAPAAAAGDENALRSAVAEWVANVRTIDGKLKGIADKFQKTKESPVGLTLAEISQQYTPSIDWPTLLNGIDRRMDGNTKVLIKCRECFVELEKLWSGTDPIQMRHYLEIQIVLKYSYALDGRFREFTWGKPPPDTAASQMTIPSICMARTATHFEKQLDRLYIDNKFDGESQRIVAGMVREIQAEYRKMLEEAEWMDPGKRRAIDKFDKMESLVGYFREIKNDDQLAGENSCYDFGPPGSLLSFGEMEMLASKCTNVKTLRTNVLVDDMGQLLLFLDEYIRSYEPNGFYEFTRNIFVVLAAILQIPLFEKGMPEPLLFGGIGILIGHEITHGFDNRGRRYNERGLEENWWDQRTEQRFNDRTQCFVQQYGKFKVRIDDQTELPVDGQLTLSENIPDNGGLKASFRTFQRLLLMSIRSGQKRKQIRGMEHFTESQLFFLNFAFSLCSVENGQYRRRMLATDIHSPNPARVNLVVGNSQAFVEAFGCKQGDKMFIRQSERCELW